MQKKYKSHDYLLAVLVTLGCSIFVLYPVMLSLLSPAFLVSFKNLYEMGIGRILPRPFGFWY